MTTLLFAFAITVIGPLAAQNALHIDLSGDWQMRDATNQQNIGTYRLPRSRRPLTAIFWLHRDVPIPAWTDTSQLALTLGPLADAYAVYVNDRLLAATSEFRLSALHLPRARTFVIPPGLVQPGANLHLSLRAWRVIAVNRVYLQLAPLPDRGPYVLTGVANAPINPDASDLRHREIATGTGLLTATIGLTLAALLILMWLTYRSRSELLLLAGYLLGEQLTRVADAAVVFQDWPVMAGYVSVLLTPLGFASLLLFAARMANNEARWVRWVAWLPLAARLAGFYDAWRRNGVEENWLNGTAYYSYQAGALLLAAIALVAAIERIRASDSNRVHVWLLAMIAVLGLASSVRLGANVVSIYIGAYRLQLYDVTGLILATAIGVLLFREIGKDRARLAGELEAARGIQQLLLQAAAPSSPTLAVDAAYLPAQEVGGDFYHIFDNPAGSRYLLAGDVSGKGLPAAMLVSFVIGAVRPDLESPAVILAAINQRLVAHGGGGFVTCCCLRIDPDGRITASNAGHVPPYVAGVEMTLPPGLPLGISDGINYEEAVNAFATGQQVTIVSDGVVEAANAKGELFGFERTAAISARPAKEIAETAQAWGQNDDITVVTVRRLA